MFLVLPQRHLFLQITHAIEGIEEIEGHALEALEDQLIYLRGTRCKVIIIGARDSQ